jgi:endonuclease/exonuclease/phosphatase family metal-dependent hydrolase
MRIAKRIALVVGAFVFAVMSYRVFGVYQFREGECTPREPARFNRTYPERLVVMAFNIEGHASLINPLHIEKVVETILKYDPDIVAINEAHRKTWQARFGDHVDDLAKRTGMNVVFGRSFRFAGGDFGNAVLTKGRIVASDVHKLPGRGEPRTLLETIVQVNGGTIEFYVTHTAAWASLGRGPRTRQLDCIARHVGASAHPFILAGDLNAGPDSPEITAFLADGVLRLTGDPAEPTHRILRQKLDYVLTDRGWRIVRAVVLDDGPSDHRPVLVELTHP